MGGVPPDGNPVDCVQPAAALMPAACCGMDRQTVSERKSNARQLAGNTGKRQRAAAVQGESRRCQTQQKTSGYLLPRGSWRDSLTMFAR